MTSNNIDFYSGENSKYIIKYKRYGVERTYRPDFIIDNTIVEIKPKKLQCKKSVKRKALAGRRFAKANNLTYIMIEPTVNYSKIYTLWKNGKINILERTQNEFDIFIAKHYKIEQNKKFRYASICSTRT